VDPDVNAPIIELKRPASGTDRPPVRFGAMSDSTSTAPLVQPMSRADHIAGLFRRDAMLRLSPAAAVALGLSVAAGLASFGVAGAQSADPVAAPATRPSTTQPTTRPDDPRSLSADQLLGQMLRPAPGGQPKPLQPIVDQPALDRTSGPGAVKPNAPAVATLREGTYMPERVGRLAKTPDGTQAEFVFETDGHALKDPPLIILPNLKLMMMENMVTGAGRDLRFRVSGVITEYRGRNYILLEKVFVVPEVTQQF
jgi:hypothetical protein